RSAGSKGSAAQVRATGACVRRFFHMSGSDFSPAPMTPRWPSVLWVVRHGESAGNVARDAAQAARAHRIALDHRDVDVPLSDLGKKQSRALGEWFAAGQEDGRPEVILASPYIRAVQTAEIFRD